MPRGFLSLLEVILGSPNPVFNHLWSPGDTAIPAPSGPLLLGPLATASNTILLTDSLGGGRGGGAVAVGGANGFFGGQLA